MSGHQARAFAKINLTLDVGERRTDGYHEIRTILQTIDLHDNIRVEPSRRRRISLTVSGEFASSSPSDGTNLVVRAAEAMLADGGGPLGLAIELEKNIPAQAGLGGGSSDAATTLRLLNALRKQPLTFTALTAIAASLGADVPYFLQGGTCLVEGVGQRVTPLTPIDRMAVLIAKPNAFGVSTAAAYAALDEAADRSSRDATDAWLSGDKTARHMVLHNDFDRVVAPQSAPIARLQVRLADVAARYGQRPPHLCGSGAAQFVLCCNEPMTDTFMQSIGETTDVRFWFVHTVSAETALNE